MNKDATLAEFEKINEALLFFVLAKGRLALVLDRHGSGEVALRGELEFVRDSGGWGSDSWLLVSG